MIDGAKRAAERTNYEFSRGNYGPERLRCG
jgi:hypothetical protein